MTDAPVVGIPTDPEVAKLEATPALCLSGGGYRAMVFHIGVLWRLYEAGLLASVKRISSVSGGSITAGVLALKWRELSFEPAHLSTISCPKFVAPLRALPARRSTRSRSFSGALLPGSISDRVAGAYDEHLFDGATLQDLPDEPRFVINATNVQSGVLWRFMKPYMRDYRVGEVKKPTVPLAQAVAASSAFPPVLSPFEMRLDPDSVHAGIRAGPAAPALHQQGVLTDGGVYDNLGLETAWKRYQTILVSDAGGKIAGRRRSPRATGRGIPTACST